MRHRNTHPVERSDDRTVRRDLEQDLIDDEIVNRTPPRQMTPRRYDERAEDPVMPSKESSLNTKM
jgi:hypothetical protein